MSEWVDKFRDIKREIAHEKGDLALFALVEREGSAGKWDVVVSASWFGEERMPILEYLADKLTSALHAEELLSVSRIVLLDPSEEFVTRINALVKDGTGDLSDVDFNGMFITRAHVLTLQLDRSAGGKEEGAPRTLYEFIESPREPAVQP